MKHYNCNNENFIRAVYTDKNMLVDENNALAAQNTRLEGQIQVCYLGNEKSNEDIYHLVLELMPCADGKIRTHLDNWKQVGNRYFLIKTLKTDAIQGDEQLAQNICQHIADNGLEGEKAIRYLGAISNKEAQNA